MKQLKCIKCGLEREVGRRMCRPCYLSFKTQYAKERYKQLGRYFYTNNCVACKTVFKAWRKHQLLCKSCHQLKLNLATSTKHVNEYARGGGKGYCWLHRRIAEEIIGRKLHTNEVVHHLDNDPKNNDLKNLIVLDRRKHSKLHQYLDLQRVIWEKSQNENVENCWKTLIVPITNAWLETTSVKVIKIWEIGQSAAKPLKLFNSHEEGSETMHDAPETSNVVGDDIVQHAKQVKLVG